MFVRIHAKDVIHYSELLSNVYTLKVGIYDKVGPFGFQEYVENIRGTIFSGSLVSFLLKSLKLVER